MSAKTERLVAAAFAAVSALMTVLAGDPKRKGDRGMMPRVTHGSRHVYACNRGMYLAPGQHETGGSPCSERCVQAHEAIRLGAVFLQMLIDECNAAAEPRLREARTGAALIEMAATGRARGQRVKRQTPADQPATLEAV